MPLHLNLTQRIVLVVYLLALAYCCAWIPWQTSEQTRIGYGWLWSPPDPSHAFPEYHWNRLDVASMVPEYRLVVLRIAVVTAIGAAAMVLAGTATKKSPRVES